MKKKNVLVIIFLIPTLLCYAQMQLPFTAYENNPILQHGEPGSWDESHIIWSFMFVDNDTYYLYYTSGPDIWNLPTAIGVAISTDGYEFTKSEENPIFEADATGFDAYSVSFSVVIYHEGEYKLFYSGQSNPGSALGIGIGQATANNPEGPWTSEPDPILEVGSAGEWDSKAITPESVIETDSGLIMFYSGFKDYNPAMVGLAYFNGTSWIKYDDPLTTTLPYAESDPVLKAGSAGSWDDENAALCNVYKIATGLEMFYTGSHLDNWKIGYATSENGIHWLKYPDNPIYSYEDDPFAMSHGYHVAANPTVMIKDGTYFMYYDYGLLGPGYFSLAQADALVQTINVPGDQPTIQAAIDVATHGDIVLVEDGTYYENIDFMGKAITVASHFIIDWDESHIENTIIDGSQATNPDMAATVMFVNGEDTTSVIKGFTITGGTGILNATYNVMNGGGIAVEESGAKIEDNIITENNMEHFNGAGGCGIGAITLTGETWLVVRNNEIVNNSAIAHGISAFGGGIASTMNSIIQDNNIEYNECTNIDGDQADGGGIEIEQIPGSNPIFANISGNAIRYNTLTVDYVATGAGIMIYQASAHIHNNVISNNMVVANQFGNGAGIYVYDNLSEITIENNEISGNEIISESWARGGGIALWEPAYKIELLNNTIEGNNIEGENNRGPGVWFRYPSGDINVTGNLFKENTGPMENVSSARGGGLCILDATGEVIIDKNIFLDNQINDGGGLYLRNSLKAIVSNNFFEGNEAFAGGGMSYFNPAYKTTKDDLPLIVNNTIINNTAQSIGGGIDYQCPFVFPILFNSILRYNTANLGNDLYSYSSSEFVVYNCNIIEDDIFGEWTGDYNIETDPEVIDDFGHIAPSSLCIEAGTMELEVNGETYNCPDHDIDGQIRPLNGTADIGADEVLITKIFSHFDNDNSLLQISPNPGSGHINIQFTVAEQGMVICDLYEISGVKVKQLLNAEMNAGTFNKTIDLIDLSVGVYFCVLKTNKAIQSTKLIKL